MQIAVHTSPALQAWGIAVLRAVVGLVFLAHGLQKAFATGMTGVAEFMGQVGIPLPMAAAVLVTAVEIVGGLALIAGFFTRWVAIPLAIEMLVAAVVVHGPSGFFLPNGFEYALTLLASSVSLSLLGPGTYAVDNVLRLGGEPPTVTRPTTVTKAA